MPPLQALSSEQTVRNERSQPDPVLSPSSMRLLASVTGYLKETWEVLP